MSGILFSALPVGFAWEEDAGLGVLFKLRGQRPAPSDVVIVAINDDTGPQLGLSNEIPDWPRSIFAQLIDTLAAKGAAVIVMDIDFKKAQEPDQDEQFAASIRRAGNVILFGYLDQEMVRLGNTESLILSTDSLQIEHLRKPVEVLASSAAAVAPFALPKIPVKVSRFWTFHGANELATLPTAALEHYASLSYPDLISLLSSLKPSLGESLSVADGLPQNVNQIERLRSLLRGNRQLVDELLEVLELKSLSMKTQPNHQYLKALLKMYQQSSYPYLNFYGPPHSMKTITLREILSNEPEELPGLKNQAVFVGYAGQYQPKQKDGFFTVFSQRSGLDLSGVEIAATAFANLLYMETITPLEATQLSMVMLLYGMTITLLFRSVPTYWNIPAGLTASAFYFILVYQSFIREGIWLPWTIPLFVLTPLALFAAMILHYREARQARHRLQEIFGYYLPDRIIHRLTQDTAEAIEHGESAFGVCLATDAEQYTRLAEGMAPADLQSFLNRYYEILFEPVRARDGMISDVVGDAMLAIWSAPYANKDLRRKACEAALEIKQTLEDSEQISKMPTRIGLHSGQFVLSHIGAIDHFEYRAVGDIVNTASRIENLNKKLGTSILVTQETIQDLQGFITRELGIFQLRGKNQPVRLHELVCTVDALSDGINRLLGQFAEAITAYQNESWPEAYDKFQVILKDYPNDGPSQFYLGLYHERRPDNQITLQMPPQTGLRLNN